MATPTRRPLSRLGAVRLDAETLLASPEACQTLEALREQLVPPAILAARWHILSHRPVRGDQERLVPTYTIHLGLDRSGIIACDEISGDGDSVPEFDLRQLLRRIQERVPHMVWTARAEVQLQLPGGLLMQVHLRLPTGLGGEWQLLGDAPDSDAIIGTPEELTGLLATRRRITITGHFRRWQEIPEHEFHAFLAVVVPDLLDFEQSIEASWPLPFSLGQYEWE